MANPQLEDGHTKIANEIYDALMKTNFAPYERRILDCVIRKTYGWNKKMDRISYTQFEEATALNRRHIALYLARLIQRNIVIVAGAGYQLEYGLQKNYETWRSLPELVTAIITGTGNDSLPEVVTIDNSGSLPIPAKSLPIPAKSLPELVTRSLPGSVNTKARKHNKSITKAKVLQTFEEYRDSLKPKYPGIDFDHEVEKFWLYWNEGDRKLKRPKSALLNWMDKAAAWARRDGEGEKHGRPGKNRQDIGQNLYPNIPIIESGQVDPADL